MARVLDWLIVAGPAILVFRLLGSGLFRRYRAFFLYLVFATLHSGVFAIPRPNSTLYFYIWVWTEPVDWLFYVLVVLEIFSLVLEDYKGLSRVGRWALIAAVCVALLASGLALLAPSRYTTQGMLMTYYYVAERAVYFSLMVFLLTILGVLMQYPIEPSRNVLVHSIVFSVYFLANTVVYLLLSMAGESALGVVRPVFGAITLVAITAWLAVLTPAGETRKRRLRPAWMPEREEELVNQLNQLNAALLRATRRID